ncbi:MULTISPECIES: hypothetical protein [unclassified Yoonia]|uniref:hypothetical protein n=1 Tax=unclassified Yoonia TaxID=2629118 RepID=UPI002AFEFC34|nr:MULTISPECIES: hypothetical protein [unclassified Yoonia]
MKSHSLNSIVQKLAVTMIVLYVIPTGAIGQQNFSCSYGDRGACLGYGDRVCSSNSICVDQNSACFDRFQCDYEGFTCKSNVTSCVADYNDLLSEHNQLVRNYNTLLDDHRLLLAAHNELVDDYNHNLELIEELGDDLEDVETCLIYATTLGDAKLCAQ